MGLSVKSSQSDGPGPAVLGSSVLGVGLSLGNGPLSLFPLWAKSPISLATLITSPLPHPSAHDPVSLFLPGNCACSQSPVPLRAKAR